MKKQATAKKAGRPATGKKSSKPNITILNSLQEDAKEAAAVRGVGYSDYVEMALNRLIAADQTKAESDAKSKQPKSLPDSPPQTKRNHG